MRTLFGLGLVALLAFAGGCGKKAGTSGPAAPASIEGGWTLVSIEVSGKSESGVAKKSDAEKTIRATATQLIATKASGEDPVNYKLDPSKTPAQIDLTDPDGGDKGGTMYGIYKLDGDTLTICLVSSKDPADRPKEFKTTVEGHARMMTLKRK